MKRVWVHGKFQKPTCTWKQPTFLWMVMRQKQEPFNYTNLHSTWIGTVKLLVMLLCTPVIHLKSLFLSILPAKNFVQSRCISQTPSMLIKKFYFPKKLAVMAMFSGKICSRRCCTWCAFHRIFYAHSYIYVCICANKWWNICSIHTTELSVSKISSS